MHRWATDMTSSYDLPMFPLESPIVPGQPIPLHLFEPRYRVLGRHLAQLDEPEFGIVGIARGREVGGDDVRSDVGVKIFGDDLDVLQGAAKQMQSVIQGIRGATDVKTEQVAGLPILTVKLDRRALSRYGLSVGDVQNIVEIAVGGKSVGKLFEGDRRFDIVVRLPERLRGNIEAPGNANSIDPMSVRHSWRDVFPKMNLYDRYLGDGVPLCVDLPPRTFLRAGARYRLLSSPTPELQHDPTSWKGNPHAQRFALAPESPLYAALCAPATASDRRSASKTTAAQRL